PVSEVAVRPGNGLPPSKIGIPQSSARGSTLKVHLGHQVVGELVVYLNAAALRVRHQQAVVRRVERDRGGLGEGPLRLCTTHLTAAREIVRSRRYGHLGPRGKLLGVADQTREETTLRVKDLHPAPVPGVLVPGADIHVAVRVYGHVGRIRQRGSLRARAADL